MSSFNRFTPITANKVDQSMGRRDIGARRMR
jgi:hypothetical protein